MRKMMGHTVIFTLHLTLNGGMDFDQTDAIHFNFTFIPVA